ncbi:helix-turn-helix transcriptional regulator [Cerasicoccus frondis]|uniref:helix-turn-helix transcriptional regulator n=1 Tax=Cerasicoccus frondis TaxID=490090 RepID=UPI002852C581|nr:WYL domain-containing protein [Cerasicoccus frondis]
MPTTRPPLERVIRIHEQLARGAYPNCRSLAELIETSVKTIGRDIDFMRDRLSLPIEYDAARHGYYYSQPVEQFPLLSVSEGELLALFVARQALPQLKGTPFAASLEAAIHKLSCQITAQTDVSLGNLQQCLSVRVTGVSSTDIAAFQSISQATLQSRELTFDYLKLNATQPERRRVQPLHLASVNQGWYLFAHDLGRGELRTFVLNRIQGKPKTGKRFRRPKDFSISKLLADSFGIFHGTGNHQIHLRFDAFAARIVRERQWHESQILQDREDGSLELRLQLDSLEEVERWILSWGDHVEVLAPKKLADKIRRTALAIARGKSDQPSAEPTWLNELHADANAAARDDLSALLHPEHPGQLRLDFA